MTTINLFLVDNNKTYIQYLYDILDSQFNLEIIGYTTQSNEVLPFCAENKPHVIILGQIQGDSISLINAIRSRYPKTCIISITDDVDANHARQHLKAGVGGYLLRHDTSSNLASSILTVHQGQAIISSEVTRALL